MRLLSFYFGLSFVFLLLISGEFCEGRRRNHAKHSRKWKEILRNKFKEARLNRKLETDINVIQSPERKAQLQECHKFALYRCGKIFLKVSKLTNFLKGEQSYQTKCALRQAFFTCIQKLRLKPCSHRKYNKDYDIVELRKKLADKLWANRSCVLFAKGK
ncbi:uncharacterized protein LOC143251006 [Tachypleus tridentatus]|uniref:uncharacterized protein LOC143251006 n=1 Tax=Tachypleus tridentatus TaxID=6853 RepID=UPI003FD4A592